VRNGDVNDDGSVTAGDALRVINELARRAFSSENTGQLADPANVSTWPDRYFDQNGDGHATALDALRIINELARLPNSGAGGEAEWFPPLIVRPEPIFSIQGDELPTTRDDVLPPVTALFKANSFDLPASSQIISGATELQTDAESKEDAVDQALTDDLWVDAADWLQRSALV
ncbi:MAG: dockerin type I domain-containing protein, partial [Pirellulales bacterium]|nr:dockerin type I domain-containing protein [Pirellulales bacterium]